MVKERGICCISTNTVGRLVSEHSLGTYKTSLRVPPTQGFSRDEILQNAKFEFGKRDREQDEMGHERERDETRCTWSEITARRDLVQARRISQMPTPMHVLLVAGIQQRVEKRTHEVLDNVHSSVLSSVERLTKRVCIRMYRDCFQQITNFFFFFFCRSAMRQPGVMSLVILMAWDGKGNMFQT